MTPPRTVGFEVRRALLSLKTSGVARPVWSGDVARAGDGGTGSSKQPAVAVRRIQPTQGFQWRIWWFRRLALARGRSRRSQSAKPAPTSLQGERFPLRRRFAASLGLAKAFEEGITGDVHECLRLGACFYPRRSPIIPDGADMLSRGWAQVRFVEGTSRRFRDISPPVTRRRQGWVWT